MPLLSIQTSKIYCWSQGSVVFKTPEQGASTTVWASVGRELEGIGGLYLADCNEALPLEPGAQDTNGYMPYALNPDHAEQLWTLSQNLVER